jgi:peptidoglycan/xylan/chitin deacetylase (PgdA/CDA1 family)
MRRLRALVMLGAVVVGTTGAVEALTRPGDDTAAATGAGGPTTPAPPATVRPLPATPGQVPVVTRVETTDPVVFLTIDDGVTRTPEVAAALDDLGAPATLFLVDHPIEADAAFFRSLPGTAVGSHSRTHPDLTTLPEARQRDEICGNAATIERAFGRRPVLFRPPYGNHDERTRRAAAACGMVALVLWEETVEGDTISFRHVPELRPGDIVLLHFRPQLGRELRVVAQAAKKAGLRFGRLEDYLGAGG